MEVQQRLTNVEASLTIRGTDGQPRSLTQSFIDLETWAYHGVSPAETTTNHSRNCGDANRCDAKDCNVRNAISGEADAIREADATNIGLKKLENWQMLRAIDSGTKR